MNSPHSHYSHSTFNVAVSLLTFLVGLLSNIPIRAADGTWTTDAAGNWDATTLTNWSGGVGPIADGAGFTANFAADLSVARIVTLTVNRSIGNLYFDDTGTLGATEFAWTLTSSGTNILTLDNGGNSTISNNSTANTGDVTISARLAGTGNVLFNTINANGASSTVRTITVNNINNAYTGTTTLQAGNLNVGANSILSDVAGPLGKSTTAIILGNASTPAASGTPNANLVVQSINNSAAQSFLITRDIDSTATANVSGRNAIRFNSNGADAAGTLTISSNWLLGSGASRSGYGLVAQRSGQTVAFTGNISGGNATVPFRINDFSNGSGVVRLSSSGNNYAGQTTVTAGTLLIAGNAGTTGGALGTNSVLQINESGNAVSVDTGALIDGAFTVGKTISLANSTTATSAWMLGGSQAAISAFTGNVNTVANVNSRTLKLLQVAGGTVSFTGIIGANGDAVGMSHINKLGAGTVLLANANTYDGTTTVSDGTLILNNSTGSGTSMGAVSVNAAGAQNLNTSASAVYSPAGGNPTTVLTFASTAGLAIGQGVSGTNIVPGTVIQDLTGTAVTLSRTITQTINSGSAISFGSQAGILQLGDGGTTGLLAPSGSLSINAGGNFVINRSNAATQGVDFSTAGITGAGSVAQSGSGTTTLNAANTYTGTTAVNAGTLSLDNNNTTTARLAGTTNVVVITGGTLLLAQSGATASSNRINDSAAVTLAGGKLNTGGLVEGSATSAGVGALTLTGDSVIDFALGTSLFAFSNSSSATWDLTKNISIWNWSGNAVTGGGTDQLYFGTDASGLSANQIARFSFFSDSGLSPLGSASLLSTGELVPVPEPSVVATVVGLLGLIGWRERRKARLARQRERTAIPG